MRDVITDPAYWGDLTTLSLLCHSDLFLRLSLGAMIFKSDGSIYSGLFGARVSDLPKPSDYYPSHFFILYNHGNSHWDLIVYDRGDELKVVFTRADLPPIFTEWFKAWRLDRKDVLNL